MTDPEPVVLVERRGAALRLRLNRPRALNSLTPEMIDELDRGLDTAADDPSIRVVVVGAVGRAFCAGADLAGVLARTTDDDRTGGHASELGFLVRVGEVFDRIERFDKPVLAAVGGTAVAGGLELVLACDLVVATRSASFGDAHANYGILPGGGGSVRLPRRVGAARARHLMLTGVTLPAERFVATDLLTELVEDAELDATVEALVTRIAATSPLTTTVMKHLVADAAETPSSIGLRREQQALATHTHSQDYREGLAAFAGKRAPRFVGH
ncbi:enoyl-CoA hydratase/isomerase family protein [Actinomycetospora chiangmaiensis]|uniref:enoyl-CoA hydratase/isomerase family protein n=1 Tax=Actinomycetospora chiangmaiensis TaxID=402650 RepID=UPI00035C121C|nr:enoyl-CoA hydratase/isomerase family protein [Actinomycetospora chiangmaiensis]